ncbi:MAG TPA: (Fe-S)-binding protein [bacterium]|nr:(Fe-S)-binding protein [bacterium]
MHDPAGFFAPYDAAKCATCGQCLAACPVLTIDADEGRAMIATLRDGGRVAKLERGCQTCFACNFACPNGANPAQLIRARFAERMEQDGPRRWSAYFQQQRPDNFRAAAADALPAEDRELLDSWRDETPVEKILYPGCNLCNTAWLARTRLLDGYDIRGGFHVCCGEPFYRTGMDDHLRRTARNLDRWLDALGVKHMTVACTAGTCLFRYVLPRYGLQHEMEVRPLLEDLFDDFSAGRRPVERSLGLRVTVQESCYGKILGPAYMAKVRALLTMIGCTVVEMQHSHERSLCCGIGAGFAPDVGYHPLVMTAGAARVLREAGRVKADRLVSYCSGCLLTLTGMGQLYPGHVGVSHLLALLAEATGETLPDRISAVSRAMLAGALKRQFPRLLDFGRVKMPPPPLT